MKDLVALQMTRRQPMPAYDTAKAKPANTASTANRQVTHTHTQKGIDASDRRLGLQSYGCVCSLQDDVRIKFEFGGERR